MGGKGRHTTTASRSYELASGGTLIDSPGVRDFAPAEDRLDEKTLGFPEIQQRAGQCKFQDCKHLQEPGCAVIASRAIGRGPSMAVVAVPPMVRPPP